MKLQADDARVIIYDCHMFIVKATVLLKITIVNDNSSLISMGHVSHSDDTRVIIYDHNMLIIQATSNSSCYHVIMVALKQL